MKLFTSCLLILNFAKSFQACTWEIHRDSNTHHGKLKVGVQTREDCMKECLKENGCKTGFDWDRNHKGCYFSTSDKINSQSVGVDHYSCRSEEEYKNECLWVKSPDIHHVGAVPQGTVTTKKECFKKCKKSADCKNGFEWNNSKKKCLFPKPGVAANTYKGTDYYACEDDTDFEALVEGSCMRHANSKTLNGKEEVGARSIEECKNKCLKENNCEKGFDWDRNHNKCYLSTSTNIMTGAHGVDHYSCKEHMKSCIQYANSKTLNGKEEVGARSIEECKNKCLKENNCEKGFDWDRNHNKCYLSTSTNIMTGAHGVDHYSCKGYVGNCMKQVDSHTYGGEEKFGVHNMEDCKKECLKKNNCEKGFDWDRNHSKCYLSTNTNIVPRAHGVDHYTCKA